MIDKFKKSITKKNFCEIAGTDPAKAAYRKDRKSTQYTNGKALEKTLERTGIPVAGSVARLKQKL